MSFDEIPENKRELYPCPNDSCDGEVEIDENENWSCNKCSFKKQNQNKKHSGNGINNPDKVEIYK